MILVPAVLDVVRLLAEAQPPEQGCACVVFRVGERKNPMLAQRGKDKIKQASERLRGVAAALVAGVQGDANLHLVRILQKMQAAVTHHAASRLIDDGQLKPGSGDIRLAVALVVNEACCILRSERIPPLMPRHLRQ